MSLEWGRNLRSEIAADAEAAWVTVLGEDSACAREMNLRVRR
jgi:hypothetical protein